MESHTRQSPHTKHVTTASRCQDEHRRGRSDPRLVVTFTNLFRIQSERSAINHHKTTTVKSPRAQDIVKPGKPLQRPPEQRLGEAELFRGRRGWQRRTPGPQGRMRGQLGQETTRAPCSPHQRGLPLPQGSPLSPHPVGAAAQVHGGWALPREIKGHTSF